MLPTRRRGEGESSEGNDAEEGDWLSKPNARNANAVKKDGDSVEVM
jgi:hypothetical protein